MLGQAARQLARDCERQHGEWSDLVKTFVARPSAAAHSPRDLLTYRLRMRLPFDCELHDKAN